MLRCGVVAATCRTAPCKASSSLSDHTQPEPKTAVKTLKQLSARFNYLASRKDKATKQVQTDDMVGEWANVMEQEYYDFVLFEIPKVDF